MTQPRQQQIESDAKEKRPRRKHAQQISKWLAFIRPHVDRYKGLPRGEQKKYVAKLSEKTGSSVNTLLRYIAAAQILEAQGISEFPPGLNRLPVASVEAVERISKRDPARGRELFQGLIKGEWSIRELRDKLADMPQRARPVNRAVRAARIGRREFSALISAVANGDAEISLVRFADAPLGRSFNLFAKVAVPRFVAILPGDKRTAIFDEGILAWSGGPAIVTREFLRNIAIATAVFDHVIVVCNTLMTDVDMIRQDMPKECRDRVRITTGILDID